MVSPHSLRIFYVLHLAQWVYKLKESSMPAIRVKENEPFDVALRRFKRSCEKAGVLTEIRKREAYEKPTTERKRKAAAAVKRHLKKLSKERNKFARSPHQRRR